MPDPKQSSFLNSAMGYLDSQAVTPDYYSQGNNLEGVDSKNLSDELPLYTTQLDVNEMKAKNQTFFDKMANGTLQAANTAVVGTIGNTIGVLNGFSNMIMNGANGANFFDNPTFQFMDEWDESVKEAVPLYRSQQEMTGSVGDRVLDKDFIFGDLFQGLGFVGSSLIPGVGWAKAGNVARGAILASRIGKLESLAAKGLGATKEAQKLANFIRSTDKAIGVSTNLGAATFGRIYESRLESKDVYDTTYNKSYDSKVNELLEQGYTEEQAVVEADAFATKKASDARNFSFGANMLLAIPDYFQLTKIFSGLSNKVNTVNKIATGTLTEVAESGLSRTAKKVLPIALTEAAEEGTQYNIAETSKALAEKNYDPTIASFTKEFINQSIQNMASPEFLTSALAGGIIGGGMSALANSKNTDNPNLKNAIQNTNDEAELVKRTAQAEDAINKFGDLEQKKTKLAETIADKNTPEETKVKAQVAERQISNLQFAQRVKQNLELGRLDNYLLEIETLGKDSKEQSAADFGVLVSEFTEDGKEISNEQKATKLIKRANEQAAIYQYIQTNYVNLSQISKDELFNNLATTKYNDEKLNLVAAKIAKLTLEKDTAQLQGIPFTADKQSTLNNLLKEKEILIESQDQLGKRFLDIKSGKAEDRKLKTPTTEVPKQPIQKPVEDVIETITTDPASKYKGANIQVLGKAKGRVLFKVEGSNSKISLSEAEFNKQIISNTKKEESLFNTMEDKFSKPDYTTNSIDDINSVEEYAVGDALFLNTEKGAQTTKLPSKRKDLGTATFFNSPLFFKGNEITARRNTILSDPDWYSKFRITLSREYAKDKNISSKSYTQGSVDVYNNGGPQALDIIVQYNDAVEDKDNWVNFGSLPYSGMLRDSSGNPYDFSLMSYEDFVTKFYVSDIQDSNGVDQVIEFTPDQFDRLKIEQGIFKEFELLAKQYYSRSSEEVMTLPSDSIDFRLSYFVSTGEQLLTDLLTNPSFINSKMLVISNGVINKDLTNTTVRKAVPDYLIDTYGTSNKTYINLELPNGTDFWTIAYTKGNSKTLETKNIVPNLKELAVNYSKTSVTPENDIIVNDIIKNINQDLFISNSLQSYLNFRVFPLEDKTGYKIKIQLKTEQGVKYIDLFNPETTIKTDGTNLTIEELDKFFSFDNISNVINEGFSKQGINLNVNPENFIANNTKGNPKLEELTVPVNNIDLNLKFDYHLEKLPTLTSNTVVEKSKDSSIDTDVIKEVEEQKAKLADKKKTQFSKPLGEETIDLTYLNNVVSKFKEQYNLDVVLEPIFDSLNNPIKGKFENGVVYLNPQYVTLDTPIHEVIHPFIEVIKSTNPKLYKNLILEMKGSDIGKRVIDVISNNYSDHTDTEILDESLVTLMGYYASRVIPSNETGLLGSIKAFFKKVSEFIKDTFGKYINPFELSTTTTIAELSDIIATGTIDLGSIYITPKESKLDLLSANDSIKLINTIGAKTVQRITEKPTKENLQPIIDSIIEQTKIENNTENIDASSIEDKAEQKAYKLKRHLIYSALTLSENIESITKSVTEDILKMYYSEEATYSEEDDTVQNVNDEADIKDYDEGVENSGGWNNVDPEVRNFIYYNTYTYIDEAGYEITEAVDGIRVYKALQSSLADQDSDNFIPILDSLAKYDIQIKSVLDNFKVKVGFDNQGTKTLSQSNFYNKFFKSFENTKLEYTQVFETDKKKLVVASANKSMTAGRLLNRWRNNFIVNKDSLKSNAGSLRKILNDIGSEVVVTPNEIVNSLYIGLSNLGIEVSKPYLEYSFIPESNLAVFSSQGLVKLDIDTISKLINSINKDIDIFESGEKGAKTILQQVADADSVFRADSVEDMYRDSRGKLRSSYTKQNLITKSISKWKKAILDTDFIKSIKEDTNNYYHYNYLFNNKLFSTEAEIQEVFRNADLSLIGDIRIGDDKYTTRSIITDAFSKMQLALYKNATSPKDIVDNSVFKFDTRTNTRQKFALVDFGKISDKNTEVALKLPIDDRFFDNGQFTDWYTEQVYNTIFLQEYNKLKNYDNKSRLYYSKDKPLTLNPAVTKKIKANEAWMNLSIFNNSVIDQFVATYNKPEYLELKDLLLVDDLSTKKELIKKYFNESFTISYNDYKNILASEGTIDIKEANTDLGNMVANNFILRTSFQQLVKGDLAVSKDLDDDLKRNGRVTAYGDSGIDFTKEKSSTYKVLYMTEAINYKVLENNNFRDLTTEEDALREANKPVTGLVEINSDDAGVRMTVKHFIDTLQRLGRLTDETLRILTKVDNGEKLSDSEVSKIDLIPLKGVHGGIDRYFKMSQLTLTKEFTSVQDKQGNWISRVGREQLHNMRVLMETNGIGLAIPKSASKSISKALFNQKDLYSGSEFNITENSEDVTWEDWRLQVENSSGKIEISQPVQILQMIDGSSKVPQAIKDELQTLYSEQREDDFNDALNIATGNTAFGKEELVKKFYDNAISSASDANTLAYLEGNYNVNLPMITFMYENYYTSHFNKGVMAQKIPGYKCTLAPATGIQVVRNTQTGEIVRSDVYEANKANFKGKEYQVTQLRIHSEQSPYAECLMTKSQAKRLGIDIGDIVSQDVFKMVGTRLPCQGYSSMIPIKIVDFLPEYYGSTIIAPEEIVYIAGSDYDVDSLFIMRKEGYYTEEGTRYYTYNEPDNDTRWNDYYRYLTTANKNVIGKIREGVSTEDALRGFNYPATKEEFLAIEKELGYKLNSKFAVTNRIIDLYEEILTNPDMLSDLHQPVTTSGFDVIGKAIYLDLYKQGGRLNYFHNSDKALKKHFELATQGKRDVGPAALGASVSSFFKKHKVVLKEEYHFLFNGKPVTNVYEDNVIDFDFIYNKEGKVVTNENGIPLTTDITEVSKQEVHSGLVSITVDNQKDPVCFMLNLDEANTGIASTMIHLGIGGKGFISTLMNTEVVKYNLPVSIDLPVVEVTKEMLVKALVGKSNPIEDNSIAYLYKRLKAISGSTFNLSTLIATNKGIGSTFDDLDKINSAYRSLQGSENVFSNTNLAIQENKNLKINLEYVNSVNNEVLAKEFLGRSPYMNNLRDYFSNLVKKSDINLDKDFNGFLISNILKHNRNADMLAMTQLALPNSQNSIISKYYQLSKLPEFKNNVLVKFLSVEKGNSTKPDLLFFNQSIKLNGKSLENLTDGYRELLQSENEEISEFAKNMFYYLIIKDNMKYTVNSFSKLLAPEVFGQLSDDLGIAVQGIMEADDSKLLAITGKTFNQLNSEFIETYVRWVGNTGKFINNSAGKLKNYNIKSKRDGDRNYIIDASQATVPIFGLDKQGNHTFPDFLRADSSMYRLINTNGRQALYDKIDYIGLSIISPYHLDVETNRKLFLNRDRLTQAPITSNNQNEDFVPNTEASTSMIGNSEAKKPEEYIDYTVVEEDLAEQILRLEPREESNIEELSQTLELLEPTINTDKPSDILGESVTDALDQNITAYFEDFYYSLTNQEKSKLANVGIPRLNTPTDIVKDFNKVKSVYNNDFNKYIEYLRNCRLA
jgi:hypothetical protein